MESLRIVPDAEDGLFSDVRREDVQGGGVLAIGGLAEGTIEGKPTVMIRMTLADGTVAVGETTLALLLTAADALKARHGDPR